MHRTARRTSPSLRLCHAGGQSKVTGGGQPTWVNVHGGRLIGMRQTGTVWVTGAGQPTCESVHGGPLTIGGQTGSLWVTGQRTGVEATGMHGGPIVAGAAGAQSG